MTEYERGYYLSLIRVQFANMTKREKRRMWRKHRLMYIAIERLSKGTK